MISRYRPGMVHDSDGEYVRHEDVAIQVTRRDERIADLINEVRLLKEKNDGLNAVKFRSFNGDECWIWQGDGEDNLATLTCPVVIQPSVLSGFLARIAELTAERDDARVDAAMKLTALTSIEAALAKEKA